MAFCTVLHAVEAQQLAGTVEHESNDHWLVLVERGADYSCDWFMRDRLFRAVFGALSVCEVSCALGTIRGFQQYGHVRGCVGRLINQPCHRVIRRPRAVLAVFLEHFCETGCVPSYVADAFARVEQFARLDDGTHVPDATRERSADGAECALLHAIHAHERREHGECHCHVVVGPRGRPFITRDVHDVPLSYPGLHRLHCLNEERLLIQPRR